MMNNINKLLTTMIIMKVFVYGLFPSKLIVNC